MDYEEWAAKVADEVSPSVREQSIAAGQEQFRMRRQGLLTSQSGGAQAAAEALRILEETLSELM